MLGRFGRPRIGNAALHDFHEILAIAMCAVQNGVPSHDTFCRLFRMLDPEQFRAAFQRFMAGFAEQCEGVVF